MEYRSVIAMNLLMLNGDLERNKIKNAMLQCVFLKRVSA